MNNKKRKENEFNRIINTHSKSFSSLFISSSPLIQGSILLHDAIIDTENAYTILSARIRDIDRKLSCYGLCTLDSINKNGRVL